VSLPLLAELNRRRVFRAIVGYGIAAFAVLQIIEPVMHGLHWPEAVLSYVVVALALGFPLVVALAWVFDVKAGRIERTAPAPGLRGVRLAAVIIGIGVLAAAPGVVWYLFLRPGARSPLSEDAMRAKLEAVPPASDIRAVPSIAVLPLVNLSRDPDQEFFADGLAEELLNLLAKVPGLHVAGRTSSFSFKGRNEDLRAIGQKLSVKTVLEGSVQRAGDRLRITTQLINAADGYHLWSETYDRKLTDVFAVQDEIARSVVAALKVQLLPEKAAALEGPATNPDAYAQVLLGRHLIVRGSLEGYQLALAAFRKAVELDPKYAPAWAGVAKASFHVGEAVGWHLESRENDFARTLAAADKAIELGPDLADGYAARGYVRVLKTTDWAGAQADLARALALSPGNADAIGSQGDLLSTLGRLPEAIAALRRATELDPLSVHAAWRLAWFHLGAGHVEEAREIARRTLELFPEHAHTARTLGFALLLEGSLDEAQAAFQRSTSEPFREMGTALVEHARGHARESQQALEHIIATSGKESTYQIAEIYAFRGERERAFEWLEQSLELQDAGMRYLKHDPLLRSLRADPRYIALLKKMNLPLD
jgi:TolB-like protein/cytochrome c-type biogenesis protein CcmH/NrfG